MINKTWVASYILRRKWTVFHLWERHTVTNGWHWLLPWILDEGFVAKWYLKWVLKFKLSQDRVIWSRLSMWLGIQWVASWDGKTHSNYKRFHCMGWCAGRNDKARVGWVQKLILLLLDSEHNVTSCFNLLLPWLSCQDEPDLGYISQNKPCLLFLKVSVNVGFFFAAGNVLTWVRAVQVAVIPGWRSAICNTCRIVNFYVVKR